MSESHTHTQYGDHGYLMNETRMEPTTGTRCPTLFDKWHRIFYTPSRTDTAGHTMVFIYPVMDHWEESQGGPVLGAPDANRRPVDPESNSLPTRPRSPSLRGESRIPLIKVLHAQLIFQLQSFPYDPKYINLYRVNTNLPQ